MKFFLQIDAIYNNPNKLVIYNTRGDKLLTTGLKSCTSLFRTIGQAPEFEVLIKNTSGEHCYSCNITIRKDFTFRVLNYTLIRLLADHNTGWYNVLLVLLARTSKA